MGHVEHGQPLRVEDVKTDARYYEGPGSGPVGSELAVPLTVDGETLGCVIVSSERTFGFTEQDEALLVAAAGPLAQAIRVALLHRSTLPATEMDTLTGALNRHGIEKALAAALSTASDQHLLWLAAFELRSLGHYNRRHGFRAGDAALQALAHHLAERLGAAAVIGRLSGDQFLAILPSDSMQAAAALVRTTADSWAGTKVEAAGAVCLVPPVVHGLVQYPRDLDRFNDVISWADQFLQLTPEQARKQSARSAGD